MDTNEIETLLKLGSLDDAEASRRAPIVVEDFNRIGFQTFQLSCWAYPIPVGDRYVSTPLPEYHFGDTGFSVHKATNAHDDNATWNSGTGLDRGHLQFFSKASKLGHKLIPDLWLNAKKLRAELRNPHQHLDTLEEVWWLGRWVGMNEICYGEPMRGDLKKDVDWQFSIGKSRFSSGLKINLEVKRLKRDTLRHLRGRKMLMYDFGEFCREQVLDKFHPSGLNEVNVLAISLFGEIDRDVQDVVSEWLLSDQNSSARCGRGDRLIDAVLIATREARRRSGFDQQLSNAKARLVKSHIVEPDIEDKSFFFRYETTRRGVAGFPQQFQ